LVGHSAGAKLIQQAAEGLISNNKIQQERPFIHLTFLDAFRPLLPSPPFFDNYGNLENYPLHFSEHYVDVNDLVPFTNDYLPQAFNFDITKWPSDNPNFEKRDNGHQWPRYWYEKSVITWDFSSIPPKSGFAYGYPLSRESGDNLLSSSIGNGLATQLPVGKHCILTGVQDSCVSQ